MASKINVMNMLQAVDAWDEVISRHPSRSRTHILSVSYVEKKEIVIHHLGELGEMAGTVPIRKGRIPN